MDIKQRFWLIELLAYWEGRVNTSVLGQLLGLSRQQSHADIKKYCGVAPGNLTYDPSCKAYLPNQSFERYFISEDVADYLSWMHSPSADPSVQVAANLHLPNLALSLPARQVSPEVMRGLTAAIRQNRRVEVDYVSLSNPDRHGRIIAPHSFVRTGLRWHLRAWCEKSREYRDFVLSRFRGTPDLHDKSDHTAEGDEGWNTQVTVILKPDPRLSEDKRRVLENDYQMEGGELRITTKACLVNYLLRELQISTKMLDGTPEAQQLVLVNLVDIKLWLFEG